MVPIINALLLLINYYHTEHVVGTTVRFNRVVGIVDLVHRNDNQQVEKKRCEIRPETQSKYVFPIIYCLLSMVFPRGSQEGFLISYFLLRSLRNSEKYKRIRKDR